MMFSHNITGKTDDKGVFRYFQIESLKEYFKLNKNQKFSVTFTPLDDDVSKDYFKRWQYLIMPQVHKAFVNGGYNYTQEKVEETLKDLCYITQEIKFINDKRTIRLKELTELTNKEMYHFIQFVIQIIAENFNTVINE